MHYSNLVLHFQVLKYPFWSLFLYAFMSETEILKFVLIKDLCLGWISINISGECVAIQVQIYNSSLLTVLLQCMWETTHIFRCRLNQDIWNFQNLLDYETFAKLLKSMNSKSDVMKKLENLWKKSKDYTKSIAQMLMCNFNDKGVYVINRNQNM